jgi:hypothetical protein
VFAAARTNLMVELLTNHLFHAALGEGQDFVDRVFHFLFPFLSFLTSYIDIIQTRLEAVNKKKRFFCDFFGTPFARANTMPNLTFGFGTTFILQRAVSPLIATTYDFRGGPRST